MGAPRRPAPRAPEPAPRPPEPLPLAPVCGCLGAVEAPHAFAPPAACAWAPPSRSSPPPAVFSTVTAAPPA
eukprot:3936449-Pleurochrysis_carterae.AAC.3